MTPLRGRPPTLRVQRCGATPETLAAARRCRELRAKYYHGLRYCARVAGVSQQALAEFERGTLRLDGETSRRLLAYFRLEGWGSSPTLTDDRPTIHH